MPRYFTHIRTSLGELIEDHEGDELEDVAASKAEALATATALMAKSRGLDWRACSLEITDEQGETVFVLPFSEAPQPRRV